MSPKWIKTDYLPPGGKTWHQIGSAEVRETKRALLRQARSLLRNVDAELRKLERQKRLQKSKRNLEVLEFERDMARALGLWDRYVSTEGKKLVSQATLAAKQAAESALEKAKKIFGL